MYNLIDLKREFIPVPNFMILVTCADPPLVEKHCEKYGANALQGLGKVPTPIEVFAFNDDQKLSPLCILILVCED
jgi:hypothetical protein